MSSIWKVPPLGRLRTSALTTWAVSDSTSSRTRAEAAPWPPLTARKALVMAMAILPGSKPTTAPLRRMMWKLLHWLPWSALTGAGWLGRTASGLDSMFWIVCM